MIKFKKLGDGYENKEFDFYIVKNDEFNNWDIYVGNEWAAEAKTKRELTAFADQMAHAKLAEA